MATKELAPVHAGEILLDEFLVPMGISQYRLAMDISVSPRRIHEIVHGKRAIRRTRPCDWLDISGHQRCSG
jgi:antitoxin HigA-1